MTTSLPRVQVTRAFLGLVHMSVCAVDDATNEEILSVCNSENPCGTTNGWAEVVRNPEEESMKPVPCADNEGRTHFLVSC